MSKNKTIVFVSSLVHPWGGSEDLWKKSALIFIDKGYDVQVFKENVDYQNQHIKDLIHAGIKVYDIGHSRTSFLRTLKAKITTTLIRGLNCFYSKFLGRSFHHYKFRKHLGKLKPDLVVVAQSMNFDGIQYAAECISLNLPYVIIAQKAVETKWLIPAERAISIQSYQLAKACYFVSNHNQNLTEEQLGIRLTNAHIVYNPIKVSRKALPLPKSEIISFACIGRLCILDKGQDILLRILARPIWRKRSISVSFIGSGEDEDGLKALVRLLDLKNIEFIPFVANIENLWKDYHALLLPSRYEGLPLAIMEAMAVGRVVITTNAGGNREVIENNVTGFIGEANENSFAEIMEDAWSKKDNWQDIGLNANHFINNNIPASPENEFANTLMKLIHG
jgi:glycosyltransferase involved in cell wall biosynthesis